jgi:hypothetical protein
MFTVYFSALTISESTTRTVTVQKKSFKNCFVSYEVYKME